nr:MAG TPA: hypothetical protein [Caudoviricetes sp.]
MAGTARTAHPRVVDTVCPPMSHLDRPTDFYHQRFAVIRFGLGGP